MSRTMKDIHEIARNFAGHDTLTFSVIKEMLHSDILSALQRSQVADGLVFQGGTALRLGYQNNRYSEDLDFARTGAPLSESQFAAFKEILHESIESRYGLGVRFKDPKLDLADRTAEDNIVVHRWCAIIELEDKVNGRTQKINIEIADIPAYEFEPRIIQSPYEAFGAEPVVVNMSSKEEIFSDKIIAVAGRPFLKARDLWDIHFLQKSGSRPNRDFIDRKRSDYQLGTQADLVNELHAKAQAMKTPEALNTFKQEMSRFLPMTQREWLNDGASQALLNGVADNVKTYADTLVPKPTSSQAISRRTEITIQESEVLSAVTTASVMLQLIKTKQPKDANQEMAILEGALVTLDSALEKSDVSSFSPTLVDQLSTLDNDIQTLSGDYLMAGTELNQNQAAQKLVREYELTADSPASPTMD